VIGIRSPSLSGSVFSELTAAARASLAELAELIEEPAA
jgi:hypothetical protein